MILAMRRQMRQMKPEVKYFDVVLGDSVSTGEFFIRAEYNNDTYLAVDRIVSLSITSSTSFLGGLMHNNSQGTGQGNRIGNAIFMKSMNFRFFVASNLNASFTYRVVIFGVDISSLYDATAPARLNNFFYGTVPYSSTYKPIDRKFFRVYYDKVFSMQCYDNTSDSARRHHNINLRFNRKIISRDNTAGTFIAKQGRYRIFMTAFANYGQTDANVVLGYLQGRVRAYYTDA